MRQKSFFVATALSLFCVCAEGVELSDNLVKSQAIQVIGLQNKVTILQDQTCSTSLIQVTILKDDMILLKKEEEVDSLETIEEFLKICEEELSQTAQDPTSIRIFVAGNFTIDSLVKAADQIFSTVAFDMEKSQEQISLRQKGEDQNAYVTLQFIPENGLIETYYDLKKFWMTKQIETILRNGLPTSSPFYTSLTSSLTENKFSFACSITATCPQHYALETLEQLVLHQEEIKRTPFTQAQFDSSKKQILAHIEKCKGLVKKANSYEILSMRMDLLQAGNASVSLQDFLVASVELLNEISIEKLNSYMATLFHDDMRSVLVNAPIFSSLVVGNIAKTIEVAKNPALRVDKSISSLNNTISESIEVSYSDPFTRNLHLKETDKKAITNLVEAVAYTSILKLPFQQKELSAKGDKIDHVHPLRFLGYVFNDKELIKAMHSIKGDIFRWKGFVYGTASGRPGFADRFKEDRFSDAFEYISYFCKHLGLTPSQEERVRKYAERKEWDSIISYLIDQKK
ncbi:MAG: hypothetical protein HKM07_07910 [Chlamydiae bacterium]|nr:hypothetical protein [Chlamydiota bacterium]